MWVEKLPPHEAFNRNQFVLRKHATHLITLHEHTGHFDACESLALRHRNVTFVLLIGIGCRERAQIQQLKLVRHGEIAGA